METRRLPLSISRLFFGVCGFWLIGLGLYFMFVRPALLPEDLRFVGARPAEIQLVVPGLARWLHRVFTVMGGFITGAGLLTIVAVANASALRQRWSGIMLALAGLFTVGTMSVTNFQLNSDFRWLLLMPSAIWSVGLASLALTRRTDDGASFDSMGSA